MKTKITFITAMCTFLLCGCVDDGSNYDYVQINDIEITGIEGTYSVDMLDMLHISPVLTRSLGQTEEGLEYSWTLYEPTKTFYSPDTLALTRDLDIQVDIVPGSYTVSYRVKDTGTGISYRHEFKISVTSEFQRGFMALSEVDGKANVTFINANGKLNEDIYYTLNGEYAGTNPVAILYTYRSPLDYVMILCDDERGGVYLGSTSFKRMFDFKEFFYEGAPEPFLPQNLVTTEYYGTVLDYQAYGGQIYFMNGGKLHLRDLNYTATLTNGDKIPVETKFYSAFPGDYELSPISFHALSHELFFDMKHRRFMYIPSFAQPNLFVTAADIEGLFNPADVGMDLVWGKFTLSPRNFYLCNAIFRDDDGGTHYLKIDMTVKSAVKPVKKVEIPEAFRICGASLFTGNSLEDCIYFAVESKVYLYDCLLNQERELYDFSETAPDCTIDLIRWHEALITDRVMHVCVSNPGQSGKNGSIFEMLVAPDGKLSVMQRYDNVCGRVVSAHWKN